jgi:hypothetical protein
MDNHTGFNQTLKDLCLRLAHFVLTNNFVVCKELDHAIYRQNIGTAMGTSFSVIYAVIFMIRLETPIIDDARFRPHIRLYKRFIDDLILIWTGSAARLCEFRSALASAVEEISLNWGGYGSQQDALNPTVVAATRHDKAEFLDLVMAVERCSVTTRTSSVEHYMESDTSSVPQAWQRIRLHSLHLLPCTPYLPRMDSGGATQALDS